MVLYIGHRATSAAVQDENGEAITPFEISFTASFFDLTATGSEQIQP
jgi:hypothetical protein